jgi:archaemetzincin
MSDVSKRIITLVPVGIVPRPPIEYLQDHLGARFRARVEIGEEEEIPAAALDTRRNQLKAQVVLQKLARSTGRGIMLGVIDRDLYVPGLNFVFGIAASGAALVSLYRLHQALPLGLEGQNRFLQRTLTEAVHELGHVYGLSHCSNQSCVMFFSNRMQDTDRKGSFFCDHCASRLNMF